MRYSYQDTGDKTQYVEATSPEEAIRIAPNRGEHSGVMYEPTQRIDSSGTSAINSSSLQNFQQAPTIPGAQTDTTNYSSMISGTMASVPQLPAVDNTEKTNYKSIMARVGELTGLVGNKETDTANALASDEIKQKQQDVQNYTAQLDTLNKEAEAEKLQVENNSNGEYTNTFVSGKKAEVERLRAVKALGISANLSAAQGNLSLALDQSEKSINAQYKPLEVKLATLKEQLAAAKPLMDDEEQRNAKILEAAYNKQEETIKLQKEQSTSFSKNKLSAINGGMPASTAYEAEQLFNSGKENEAYSLMGQYIKTTIEPSTKTTGGSQKFTQTQLNKGVNNAGVPYDTFKNYDDETKNWFINTPSVQQTIEKNITGPIKDGSKTLDEILQAIDANDYPAGVADYLRSKATEASPEDKGWWQGVKDFFGGLF